ncbi:MAG: hypothetical protein QOH52_1642 [Pseudonocardiales bacterium]|jgi:hypothetical protein|nr:hypothetical protein [Pseudonocardiales bacterium]
MRLRTAEALIPTVRTPLVDFPGHDQVAVAQHVRDLARLRRVRDWIDGSTRSRWTSGRLARRSHLSVSKPIRNREAPIPSRA